MCPGPTNQRPTNTNESMNATYKPENTDAIEDTIKADNYSTPNRGPATHRHFARAVKAIDGVTIITNRTVPLTISLSISEISAFDEVHEVCDEHGYSIEYHGTFDCDGEVSLWCSSED